MDIQTGGSPTVPCPGCARMFYADTAAHEFLKGMCLSCVEKLVERLTRELAEARAGAAALREWVRQEINGEVEGYPSSVGILGIDAGAPLLAYVEAMEAFMDMEERGRSDNLWAWKIADARTAVIAARKAAERGEK